MLIDPMPVMECQTFKLGKWLGLPIIDPTCGRYCLKALLKHWHEKATAFRASDVQFPSASGYKRVIAFDPYDDFPPGQQLLIEKRHWKPANLAEWVELLTSNGPIILAGVLGNASVPHFILLVGADTDRNVFIYKDPLVGDVLGEESFDTMQSRIETIVYANDDMLNLIQRVPEIEFTLQDAEVAT